MRPFKEHHQQVGGKKAKGNAKKKGGGVTKTLLKAKVSAVKTTAARSRRGCYGAEPLDEVDNLLEHSHLVAAAAATPTACNKSSPRKVGRPRKTPAKSPGRLSKAAVTMSASNLKRQIKKLQQVPST